MTDDVTISRTELTEKQEVTGEQGRRPGGGPGGFSWLLIIPPLTWHESQKDIW